MVIHNEPRLLVVNIEATFYAATVAVAHAPQSSQPMEVRRAWWETTERVLLKHQPGFLLIDANGRVGNIHTNAIGEEGNAQEEDYNGSFFHRLLALLHLCAPLR